MSPFWSIRLIPSETVKPDESAIHLTASPEEAREELAEKEKAAASCAFLHLPGEAPNGQSALARLP